MLCIYTAMHTNLRNCIKSIQFNSLVIFSVCMRLCMYSPTVFVAKQKELHPEKQVHQLQWACQQGAVNAICCTYNSLRSFRGAD